MFHAWSNNEAQGGSFLLGESLCFSIEPCASSIFPLRNREKADIRQAGHGQRMR